MPERAGGGRRAPPGWAEEGREGSTPRPNPQTHASFVGLKKTPRDLGGGFILGFSQAAPGLGTMNPRNPLSRLAVSVLGFGRGRWWGGCYSGWKESWGRSLSGKGKAKRPKTTHAPTRLLLWRADYSPSMEGHRAFFENFTQAVQDSDSFQ